MFRLKIRVSRRVYPESSLCCGEVCPKNLTVEHHFLIQMAIIRGFNTVYIRIHNYDFHFARDHVFPIFDGNSFHHCSKSWCKNQNTITEQDQVNPNGETYPVGVFISNWAASFAAQYLGATLIQVRKGWHRFDSFPKVRYEIKLDKTIWNLWFRDAF